MSLRAVGVQRGRNWVLRDLTLDVHPGERWALIGANGAGKTQLLKLLAGDVWPTPTAAGRRTYRRGRRTVDLIEAKSRIAYLGAEMQDKYSRYGWDLSVYDLIATGCIARTCCSRRLRAAERRKIDATLRACGLKRLARRRLSSLSYGQKRLALLARALCPDPTGCCSTSSTMASTRAIAAASIVRCARSVCAAAPGSSRPPRERRAAGTRGLIELDAGRLIAMRPLRAAARIAAARRGSRRRARTDWPRRGTGHCARRRRASRRARGRRSSRSATRICMSTTSRCCAG